MLLNFDKMTLLFVALSVFSILTMTSSQTLTSPTCPKNSASPKEEPSKESGLHSCRIYECNSCCGEKVTEELAIVPLGKVGALNYALCGDLSDACSEETTYLQCFYQCSPNLFPWMNTDTKVLSRLPICASFCEAYFQKCEMDKTCASGSGNWQTLYQTFPNGTTVSSCNNHPCRNYSAVYETAENLCNRIWGDLFIYTPDDQPCLHPADPKRNAEMIKNMSKSYEVMSCYSDTIPYTDAGLIVGVVLGVLAGLCLIAAGVYFFLNRKKDKATPKTKTVELAPPEERVNLEGSQPEGGKQTTDVEIHSDSDHSN